PIGEATGNPYTFVAAKGRHIVAEFVEEDVKDGEYRITAVASPAQGGSVTGAGDYEAGATVTLTATASEGYKFAGWKEGGNPIGEATGNPYTFVAAKGRHIVAVFEKINESIPTKTTIMVSDSKVTYGKPLTITVSVSSALNYSGMLELRINGKNYGEPQDIGNDGEVTWKISASKSYGFKLGDNKIETVYIGAQDAASLLPVAATVKVTSACKPQPVCKPTHYCCGQNHFTGKCVTVRSGEDVTFKVELGCNESCQWYVNRGDGCGFVKIKGATCPTLTVKDVTHKQDGYRYRCVIRNCCETIRTPIFTLNVASGQLYTPKTGDSSGIGLAIAIAAMGVCLPAVRRREDRS
ncbi:MAG: hypothetical protein IJB30_02525, partial [Clostridia bacterium]|nr:hypothetical protein [Clostridia bacterium]